MSLARLKSILWPSPETLSLVSLMMAALMVSMVIALMMAVDKQREAITEMRQELNLYQSAVTDLARQVGEQRESWKAQKSVNTEILKQLEGLRDSLK